MRARIYDMAIATYAIVVFHYLTEWFVYKTAVVSAPLLMPMFIGSESSPAVSEFDFNRINSDMHLAGSLVWMISQRSFYLH